MDGSKQLDILEENISLPSFANKLEDSGNLPLKAGKVEILQINVGKLCNLGCKHCHVQACTNSEEVMAKPVFEACLELAKNPQITTIDITGGAPEMNPHLEWFIQKARKSGKRFIVRSNLTLLLELEYRHFIDLYAGNKVEVVASLPDYQAEKTDRQRGNGVFAKCMKIMRQLNERGYGKKGSGLILDLVHNPVGAFLPGGQQALEHEYRTRLRDEHGVVFNNLFCITNMPLGRYILYLQKSGNYDDYMQLLVDSFNPCAVDNVMCKTTISVGWDGRLYDCDFNQMLGLQVEVDSSADIFSIDLERLSGRDIIIDNHCYGCVAGSGSSCQGATT